MRRILLVLALLALVACRNPSPNATATKPTSTVAPAPPPPSASAAAQVPTATAPLEPPAPAVVERLAQANEQPVSIVRSGDERKPTIVFLAGVCSNAYAYLRGFPEAARSHGGAVAIEGDQPCGAPNSGYRSFSWDAAKQNARVEAAFALAGLSANPPGGLTLVGYSAGAGIGEQMVQRWPDRYARVVLIGAPTDPSTQRLKSARAVVTMSCTLDVPWRMKDAARRLNATGVPATYMEMPGCTHGNIADGDRVFDDAFGWLTEHQRPAT